MSSRTPARSATPSDLGDVGVQRGHPLEGGAGEAVPLEVAQVGNVVDEDVGAVGQGDQVVVRTVVSPENTTEPSAVSKRYARAGIAWPWVTATAVTRTDCRRSKTTTGALGRALGPGRDGDVDAPDELRPASGMRASSGMTFRW